MAAHHPPLPKFEESLTSGARLYNRQQDALKKAVEKARLSPDKVAEIVDTYLCRMTETEVRRGPRRAAEDVSAAQTTVDDQLASGDVGDADDEPERLAA